MRCNRSNVYAPDRCFLDASGGYLDDMVALRDLAIAAAQTAIGQLLAFGDDANRRVEVFYRDSSAVLMDAIGRGCGRACPAVLASPETSSAAVAPTTAETLNDEQLGLQLCLGSDLDGDRPATLESGDRATFLDSAIRAALFVALASTSSALLTLL